MKALVTGCAGFIGFHLTKRLLKSDCETHGLDNLNNYYDVSLKESRLGILQEDYNFHFHRLELADASKVSELFSSHKFDYVVHLGAQAGVRHSLTNPQTYIDSNITGTLNILEGCRYHRVKHLIFASTSSVYGLNTKMPFSEHDGVDHPLTLYATTKRAGELMGHNYASLFGVPFTAVRFFTVYGPWGRPDMALFLFTKKIIEGETIDVFNNGNHLRDFTYVDDIVDGVESLLEQPPSESENWNSFDTDPATSSAPFKIYNIGSSRPIALSKYIELIEKKLGMKAKKNHLPLQAGDIVETSADVSELQRDSGFFAKTPIEVGVSNFVEWYSEYYKI